MTDPEIERLFDNIRRLQADGVGIIYISHRMDEIRRIANRVTVLRDGRRVATHDAAEVTPLRWSARWWATTCPSGKLLPSGLPASRPCAWSACARATASGT